MKLPNTLEQLEEEIMTARTKADVNYTYNASIIEQYEKRKKELEDLESKVNSEQNQLNKQKETIERIKVGHVTQCASNTIESMASNTSRLGQQNQ